MLAKVLRIPNPFFGIQDIIISFLRNDAPRAAAGKKSASCAVSARTGPPHLVQVMQVTFPICLASRFDGCAQSK